MPPNLFVGLSRNIRRNNCIICQKEQALWQVMLKSYKYRLYPKGKSEQQILRNLGCARWVYNWALQRKIDTYKVDGKSISGFALMRELTVLKKQEETCWLKEVDAHSLQKSIIHVETAFTNFFREKKGFPSFKSRHGRQSFKIDTTVNCDFDRNRIRLPKTGWLKCVFSRTFTGEIRHAVVSRETTGKYFISILVEDGQSIPEKPEPNISNAVGVDLGLKDFAVLSTGERIPHPKTLRKHEKQLKKLQRTVSRKVKGSNRRRKSRVRLAKKHEKVRNVRKDFLHKLSTQLVRENQTVCMENLNVSGMLKNHCLARSISDSGWSEFRRKVRYKCEWNGKNYIEIGRFDPSSKMCGKCGYINPDLKLSNRSWTCPRCSVILDRDKNAAENIAWFAFREQNLMTPTDCREVLMEGARWGSL